MLYTASFYDPDDWRGSLYRVSRSHPRGRRAVWETLPFLYPDRALLVAYRSGALDFEALSAEYRISLDARQGESVQFQDWLKKLPSLDDFTLLCFERGDRPCHRRVLAQWLLRQVPGLETGALR
ncbi:MAG: hypothetical protein BZY88_11195 [SAR202 cluster bacterium Io17-Chloro-G9]|nr:MAG: hypothetical protein BZY88_11195 [SAR202 cluster bacterium Io17-Chloro-G9]